MAVTMALIAAVAACTDDRPTSFPAGSSGGASSSTDAGTATAGATTPSVDRAAMTARVQAVVDGFTAQQPVPFRVVVMDLPTGAQVVHLADQAVPSASLYKLFVARELIRRISAGELRREAQAGDGRQRTIGECIKAMIVTSDNLCGSAGLRAVGSGALDARLHRDGFVSTSLASPQRTSAADVARFLQRAHDGTLLGPGGESGTAELFSLLRAQQVNDRLPAGLPPGTPLAHKTGDRLHWAHDAGVMSTPRGDVVVVVLSGPWNAPCCDAERPGAAEAKAFGAIAELGRELYAAVS